MASGVYTLTPAATPVFTPPDASVVAAGSTVAISSTTAGAAIYYTTDGTSPLTSSTKTLYGAPIAITAATTINAVATATGFADSAVATAAYTVLPFVATPTFNPPGGGVTLGTTVTISSTTAGAVIHYTTDGTTPGTSSAVYSTPIAITAAMTINAIATASGFSDSPVATASYTLSPLVVQNFNTATNASLPPGTINFNAVGGIVNPTDLAAAGTGHTKALAVVNTNFNSVPTVQVTLPSALSDVCEVAVRLLRGQLGRGLQVRLSLRLQHRLPVEQPIYHHGWKQQFDRGDNDRKSDRQQGSMGDRHR